MGSPRSGEGQATIEVALTLPVVLIGLLLVVQVAVVVRDSLALGLAAREGARAAAVTADDASIRAAVARSAEPLDASRIAIAVSPASGERRRGTPVTVALEYIERLRIPVVDAIVDMALPLRARATMRLEREPPPTPTPGPAP